MCRLGYYFGFELCYDDVFGVVGFLWIVLSIWRECGINVSCGDGIILFKFVNE